MNYDDVIKYLDDSKISYYINQPSVFSRTRNYLITANFNKDKSIDFVTFSKHSEDVNKHLSILLGLKKDDLKVINILEMLGINLKEYSENSIRFCNIDYYNIITYEDLHFFLDCKNVSYSIFSNKKDKDIFIKINDNRIFEIYFQDDEIKYYTIYNKDFSDVNKLISSNMQHSISKFDTIDEDYLCMKEVLYIIFSRGYYL